MRIRLALAGPLFAALLAPSLALASDAGDLDGGGEDAGALDADAGALDAGVVVVDAGVDAGPAADAGPQRPPEEGLGCTPGDGANCGSLYCVPYPAWPDYGVCRTGCESNEDCFPGRTCQDIVDKASFEVLYSACTAPTSWRDGECHAPGDPDTCSSEMSCHIARGGGSPAGPSFNCKVTCDLDAAPDAGSCADGERCNPSRFVQGFETSGAEQLVSCTPALCDDEASCECGAGFSCVTLQSGQSVCASVPGECGLPVRGIVPGDVADGGFVPFEVLCNETTDHRFCDNEPFAGLQNGGANLCVFEGELGVPDEGLCLPYCGVVDVDVNGNGQLEPGERGEQLACPEGEQCTRRLARQLLLGPGPQQLGGPYNIRGCSMAECPAGTLCAACGPGQPECMELPDPVGPYTGICLGPIMSCELAPDYDAGPSPFADAGAPPPIDAGEDPPLGEPDAGPSEPDAGGGRRLGERNGPEVSAQDCSCGQASARPAAPLGVALLFGVALCFRGRRRRPSAG